MMFKKFSIVTLFVLLGTMTTSKPLQAMNQSDPFQYGLVDTMSDRLQQLIWGSEYDSGQEPVDPWAQWEAQAINNTSEIHEIDQTTVRQKLQALLEAHPFATGMLASFIVFELIKFPLSHEEQMKQIIEPTLRVINMNNSTFVGKVTNGVIARALPEIILTFLTLPIGLIAPNLDINSSSRGCIGYFILSIIGHRLYIALA